MQIRISHCLHEVWQPWHACWKTTARQACQCEGVVGCIYFQLWQAVCPHVNLTVDEQLLGFRGNCPFRMYIPNKPANYGIKLVLICDSDTKYMLGGIPYLGKQDTTSRSGVNLGHYYTVELTRPYHGSNRNVTTDNWFTSVPLISDLLTNYGMTLVGTVRGNKRENRSKWRPRKQDNMVQVPFSTQKKWQWCRVRQNFEDKKENCASAVVATHPAYRCSKWKARDHRVLQCHQGRGRHLRPNVCRELMFKENTTLASLYHVWCVEWSMHQFVRHFLWESGKRRMAKISRRSYILELGKAAGNAYSIPSTAQLDCQCLSSVITGQGCRCTRCIICWRQVKLATSGALLWMPWKGGQKGPVPLQQMWQVQVP